MNGQWRKLPRESDRDRRCSECGRRARWLLVDDWGRWVMQACRRHRVTA